MELEEDAESHNIVENIFDKDVANLNEVELKILCYELEELITQYKKEISFLKESLFDLKSKYYDLLFH
tara:strand:- start:265 stop:468 length:204 start_codon:yes stop_codon:yes gene_type:complete